MKAGDLALEEQAEFQFRLDTNDQPVGHDIVLKDFVRRILELDHDGRRLSGHRLSCAQKEGYAFPAFAVDQEFGRHKGFGSGIRCDLLFLPVASPGLAIDLTGGILPADHILEYVCRRQWS